GLVDLLDRAVLQTLDVAGVSGLRLGPHAAGPLRPRGVLDGHPVLAGGRALLARTGGLEPALLVGHPGGDVLGPEPLDHRGERDHRVWQRLAVEQHHPGDRDDLRRLLLAASQQEGGRAAGDRPEGGTSHGASRLTGWERPRRRPGWTGPGRWAGRRR